jgi:hypothetical protein
MKNIISRGGEKMKKLRLFIVPLLVVLLFMLIVPVLANPPTVTAIKAIQLGSPSAPEDTWTTNGGIVQNRGVIVTGTIKLFIPSTAASPTYIFAQNNLYNSMTNPDIRHITIRVDAEWKYPASGTTTGTFEGQIEWNVVDGVPQAHGVLHGTGIFDGQQLMFWKDNAQTGVVWVGTLMVK